MRGELDLRPFITFEGKRYESMTIPIGREVALPFVIQESPEVRPDISLIPSAPRIARLEILNDTLYIHAMAVGTTVILLLASTAVDGISGNPYQDIPTTVEVTVQ